MLQDIAVLTVATDALTELMIALSLEKASVQ